MFKAKGLSVSGIVSAVVSAALTIIPVFLPQFVSALEIPLDDGGITLYHTCCGTAFLYIATGIVISILAGDMQSAVDFSSFLYAAAFCVIGKAKGITATGCISAIFIVASNIAWCFVWFVGIRIINSFLNMTVIHRNHDVLQKVANLPFLVLIVRYILIFAGVIDFWDYTYDITDNIMLWLFATVLAGTFFYLLKRVPRQTSLAMRVILLGLCAGYLPFLCYLTVNSSGFGADMKMYWTPMTVLSLLVIPASFLCAVLQIVRNSSDAFVSKIMTGCTTLIIMMSIFTVHTTDERGTIISLLVCPVIYQLLLNPVNKFLHPALTAVERSLDSLERTAFRCSDTARILEVVSDWIMSMFDPEFVAFYRKPEKGCKKGKFMYCDFRNQNEDKIILEQMHEDRLNNPKNEAKFMLHRKNGFSVPMYLLHEPAGFIFIGAKSQNEPFSDAEMRLMTPVTRIFMESMMVLDLRKQADYVREMQNQIVFSFADMIESRDGTTGQHIKRTSTIVSLLAKNLREHNLYADKLLPSDYDMISLAAPLHDIGKIKVPDSILSKPGKLTEQEFETIKTHPVEGEKIISKTMSPIENERYLKLAREMALYHHEKWNGQGYPEGLAGEQIPVSARIMAIADVFDALCSSRSYKEAYPVSQAFAILEESRGTHFEPCLVDAMKALKPELEKIYIET